MCGITGFLATDSAANLESYARRMADSLAHRGPDDVGVWVNEASGVALAHRRLSILDLSSAGHQPMFSDCGRYVIVFNGELYNHLDLRKGLRREAWKSHSDTETLLVAFQEWGIEKTLIQTVGMFALALWDHRARTITLARDRFGEKPMFYGWQGSTFLFGSELKALAAHPVWRGEVDRQALSSFMRYGYVPLPHAIWKGVSKLLPGSFLTLSIDTPPATLPVPTFYWRALNAANIPDYTELDEKTLTDELDLILRRAIGGQMIADVPLGAFLSGGVDSSTVVAIMQALSTRQVRTFTIGFQENDFNEAEHAKAVARHLGTDHTELYVDPADALRVIPLLPDMYDEPFGDVSQIPTHLVAAMAQQHIKVSLAGDGADELFGGYNRYFLGRSLWGRTQWLPLGLRRFAARGITAISPGRWDSLGRLLPRRFWHPMLGDRSHKFADLLSAVSADDMYINLVSQESNPESIVIADPEAGPVNNLWAVNEMSLLRTGDISERMMFHDLVSYLTDDILCKVDRAAMAVHLETREPFLDHRVAEFAWRLPLRMRIRDGQGKWLLRQVLYRYVPATLIDRPKQGFGVPIGAWLRGPLRDWADSLLDESRLRTEGYFHAAPIRRRWEEHLSLRRNWQYWLWNVLMFQAWKERWCP